MTTAISSTSANSAVNNTTASSSSTSSVNANDAAGSQDRFLKLLVAQLNNQDPMNPMDNAQMTSQIAQINTVTGIEKLNTTVQGMVDQFSSQQLMQGTALVGHQVLVEGNTMALDTKAGKAYGALDVDGAATSVKVQVLDANSKELGVVDLGAVEQGRYNFEWDASQYKGDGPLKFKVLATNGETAVASTPLTIDKVSSVSLSKGVLQLDLASGGTTTQTGIKAIL